MTRRILLLAGLLAAFSPARAAQSFFAVHCEPQTAETRFPDLVRLVAMAERHGIPLTIMFTPQWVEFVMSHPQLLVRVRQWQAWGHEVAAHHHGPYHPYWDGCTNRTDEELIGMGVDPNDRLGDMDDYRLVVEPMAGDSALVTMSGPGATDPDPGVEWQADFPYRTGGGRQPGDGFSSPHLEEMGEFLVCQIDHQFIETGSDVDTLISLFLADPTIEVVGATTHVHDFADDSTYVETWFAFAAGATQPMTAKAILEQSPCSSPAGITDPGQPDLPSGQSQGLRIWPQPTSGPLGVSLTKEVGGPIELALYDVQGRRILAETRESSPAGTVRFSLELGMLRPGVYWLEVLAGGRVGTARVVVAR
jgi:hypothetical protein